MIDFAFKNENIVISFHDKDFELNVDDLWIVPTDTIQPNYMINPNVC
jgi:hypothetical protein